MSVHLVGGGALAASDAPLYAPFLGEAAARARAAGRTVPRIAVISIHPEADERAGMLVAVLAAAGEFEPRVTALPGREPVAQAALAEVDGIAVGGGIVEHVRAGLEPVFGELRRQVAGGVPYLGVSAGAMVAAEGALGGGTRIDGVQLAPEDAGEPATEFEIEPGIGLVDVAIDAHVAQRGNLSRLVAAVESGLVEGALGIDERTALIVGEGGLRVEGFGSVWRVLPADGGVLVSTIGA
ncbi:Type 1 glutamine amidotransferase-like domain-containing protein [Agromyces lapidis]|uniref:Type 1 glutamine amidotransferase-like domain-containing protein n=1 Tax=Agromyces lapidis TaxID=279574 RepID=A0ABV5STJ1_9MICO|nr:Type 1 glutamine amidotransferase-like domain-containing protein [Agromyces lapidis]